MDPTRPEPPSGARERSLSDPAPHRRRSIGGGWFRRLGQKISGADDAKDARAGANGDAGAKRGSTGSIHTGGASDDDDDAQRPVASSFKEEFLRFGRRGSTASTTAPLSPKGGALDDMKRASRTRSHNSVQSERDKASSSEGLVDPLDDAPPKPRAQPRAPRAPLSLAELQEHGVTTRHVGFALSTFAEDPPQRIPPMRPHKGNVEFSRTGDLILGARPRPYQTPQQTYLERNHRELATTAQARAHQNAERLHMSMHSSGAGISALFSGFAQKAAPEETLDQDEPPSRVMVDHDVDGTAHVPRNMRPHVHGDDGTDWVSHATDDDLYAPDQVYIRCCHLREIMPIRNILRQLQGQHTPVPRLRVANTKPTLVEIQAFSDFLTVVPVASIALDNHVMTAEMIRLILIGLTRSRDITRLSFTNTDLDDEAWMYLCAFLASNRKSLLALNLSCTNPTAIPDRVKAFDRRARNWRLFAEALEKMGSLEELDLSGTRIAVSDLERIMRSGFKNGRVLGLANNALAFAEIKQVCAWANAEPSALMGLNLSGNDFSQDEDLSIVQSLLANPRILQLSLRNTNLTQAHADKFVRNLSPEHAAKSSLRQLDLSRNPGLFPSIMNRLVESLARFPFLSRLLLDHCGLTSDAILTLCEALSHCHRLVFVSFVGNGPLTETAATAVCVAVHQSRSICTVEADMQGWPPPLRQQLARYCIQNLERNTGALGTPATPSEDENEDIQNFYDELRAVRDEVETRGEQLDSAAAARRIEGLRKGLSTRVQTLLSTRQTRPLSVNEREALVRLYFYGNTLDRLQKQVTGATGASCALEAEEAVKNVEEDDVRPILSRSASQASVRSLKKLEREEGIAHKAYAERIRDGAPPVDNIEMLRVGDLEKIIN